MIHRVRATTPNAEDLTRATRIRCREKRGYDVTDEGEVSSLLSIPDYRVGNAGDSLSEEDTKYGAIAPVRARSGSENIEESEGERRYPIDLAPVKNELFTHYLRESVGILGADLRSFGRRVFLRDAVTRRRGGIYEA